MIIIKIFYKTTLIILLCIIFFSPIDINLSAKETGIKIVNISCDEDLQTAINNCNNPSIYNQYDIILAEGIYNVINLETRDYVNIKGATSDRNKYWIKGERQNGSSNCDAYSTINLKTTTTLENLTITCRNMRYPFHNDGCAPNTSQRILNCHIEHLGNWKVDGINPATYEESGWDSCHANGCGTSSGMVVDIENSHLIARQQGMALYAHNGHDFEKPSYIISINNILEQTDGGYAVWMDGNAISNQNDLCTLKNNTIKGKVWGKLWWFEGYGNNPGSLLNSQINEKIYMK